MCSKYPGTQSSENEVGIFASTEFQTGDMIFKEECVISALRSGFDSCSHCLGSLENVKKPLTCPHCHNATFCSNICMNTANLEYHRFLCPGNSLNPGAKEFSDYCKKKGLLYPMMVAKFISKMIYKQTILEQEKVANGGPEKASEEWDHLERLVYFPDVMSAGAKTESDLLKKALKQIAPGADEFLSVERYMAIKSAMIHNSYGLGSSTQTNEKGKVVEPVPRSSSSFGRVQGTGLYFFSAHLRHSCDPNVKVHFEYYKKDENSSSKTSTSSGHPHLVLKALRQIKPGEELMVSFIPQSKTTVKGDRIKLLDQWKVSCECSKCSIKDCKTNSTKECVGH
jgi:hypothetical protein